LKNSKDRLRPVFFFANEDGNGFLLIHPLNKIEWTSVHFLFPFHPMSSSEEKKPSFGNPIVNLLLTGLVYLFFTWLLRPYVPAQTELLKWALSAFASIALMIVFYFALNMFRVTLNDHNNRESK